jgi:hypothetical protein
MTYHAVKNMSGIERWGTCAGSLVLTKGIHDEGNEAAALGTAKHWVGAACLQGAQLADFLGETVLIAPDGSECLESASLPHRKAEARFSFPVDDAFASDVAAYINAVTEYAKGGQLWVEEDVPIDHLTGETGATGRMDAGILTPDMELQGHDAKFGYTPVDVVRNPQVMGYLSALRRMLITQGVITQDQIQRFRIVIHQPAQGPATEYAFGTSELAAFEKETRIKAARVDEAAANADKWVGKSLEYLNPAKKACEWCRAKATCPALDHLLQQQVGASFEDITAAKATPVPPPDDLPALGQKFAVLGLIEDWIKAVRAQVESILIKHNNDAETMQAVGAKLVQGRQGARKWASEDEAEKVLKALRLKQDEMYDYSLISPTTAEKLLKPAPKRWMRVQSLITRSDGMPSVAPLDDKRPALVIKPVADGFEDISQEEGARDYV